MDGSKELLKKAGRIGAALAVAHTLNAGLDSQAQPVSSQVLPPPEGHHQELKGPMPSQQAFQEQVRPLLEGEQTAETIKTDILITGLDGDYAMVRHPSRGDSQALYKRSYDLTKKEFTWEKTGSEFSVFGPWSAGVAVSPTNPNVSVVYGEEYGQVNRGRIFLSKDGGKNFQEIVVPDIGAVRYATFSKEGTLYLSANNIERTAGVAVKYDVETNTRLTATNIGLENQQYFGGPILTSPNQNETLYAVSGIEPAILQTQNGSQDWGKLFNIPSPIDSINAFSRQGKDVLLISGNGWLKMWQDGGQLQHLLDEGGLNLAVDASGPELKLYRTSGTYRIMVGGIDPSSWHEFPTTSLPADHNIAGLKFIGTPDGKKWLTMIVYHQVNLADSYGFWVYDLAQGETSGTWQQMVEGLEWKEPFPHKVYLPSLSKSFSGGW